MKTLYLDSDKNFLYEIGGINTAKEVSGQPELWRKTLLAIKSKRKDISRFLDKVFSTKNINVILTGAGTSAFVGDVLHASFNKNTGIITRSIPTTDLVTHPNYYFIKSKPTLLISFARSGNSPESVKAVELSNKTCNNIFHLVITCNEEGRLAKMTASSENNFLFLLPPEANDKSLAMTGSFSSMLLTGLLLPFIDNLESMDKNVEMMIEYGKVILNKYNNRLKEIASKEFNRAVFLGSGFFSGVAREQHLKLQELTDGKVICKYDSFLGFRHGPKAVMNSEALISYIFSNNEYSQKYEIDLSKTIVTGKTAMFQIGIMEHNIPEVNTDLKIVLNETNNEKIAEEFLAPVVVLPAQILGFHKSVALGLKPDMPSESGLISRVVEGVKLYEYENVI